MTQWLSQLYSRESCVGSTWRENKKTILRKICLHFHRLKYRFKIFIAKFCQLDRRGFYRVLHNFVFLLFVYASNCFIDTKLHKLSRKYTELPTQTIWCRVFYWKNFFRWNFRQIRVSFASIVVGEGTSRYFDLRIFETAVEVLKIFHRWSERNVWFARGERL